MTQKQILIDAKTLISDTSRWTQGAYLRNAAGIVIQVAEEAVKFCGRGAVYVTAPDKLQAAVAISALDTASEAVFGPGWNSEKVNDELGHAQILIAFDVAIDGAE